MRTRTVPHWVQSAILALSLALAAFHLSMLPSAWHDWRAGLPDHYPGQHRSLALGALGGVALCLAIPIPLLVTRVPREQRIRRAALWGVWLVPMGVDFWTLALRTRR